LNTIAELQKKAGEIELLGIDYLDKHGRYANLSNEPIHHLVFTFIDGVKVTISGKDTDLIPHDMQFRLRPERNDS
jgi:hypothetical protein